MRPAFWYWTYLISLTEALYKLYQTFHWQTRGGHYYGDHLLFQRLYESVSEELDGVAERAIGQMVSPAVADPSVISNNVARILATLIPPQDDVALDPDAMVLVALKAEKMHAELIDQMIKALEEQGAYDRGLEDFLPALAGNHQVNLYLLQQRGYKHLTGESRLASWQSETWKIATLPGWREVLKQSRGREGVAYSVLNTLKAIDKGADPQRAFEKALENENLYGTRSDVMADRRHAAKVLRQYHELDVKP